VASGDRPSARARWIVPVLYAACIFLLSSWSSPPAPPGAVSDKAVHACLYAGFALVVVRALAGGTWRGVTATAACAAVLIAAAYGASDELHQWFVPGRTADILDWRADVTGAAAAAAAAWIVARLRR
jgi:VanZ family protein